MKMCSGRLGRRLCTARMRNSSWRRGSLAQQIPAWLPSHINRTTCKAFSYAVGTWQLASSVAAASCSPGQSGRKLPTTPDAVFNATISIQADETRALDNPPRQQQQQQRAIRSQNPPRQLGGRECDTGSTPSEPGARNSFTASVTAVAGNRQGRRTDGECGGGGAGRSGGQAAEGGGRSLRSGPSGARSPSSPRQPPPATSLPQPPPQPPDHSGGGYTLVTTPAELELMLDQLAAAAVAGNAGNGSGSGSGSGGGGGGGASGGKGGGGSSVLLGGGGGLGPLAVDCEGIELGRPGGKLCLLQLSARCRRGGGGGGGRTGGGGGGDVSIWLVDVAALRRRAFQQRSRLDGATSLKGLMEDPAVIKYLYDVRRDAEALSVEYSVRLRGVVDLQLADVAVRQAEGGRRAGGWVEGLVSALSRGLAAGGRASAPVRLAADLAAATSTSRRYHDSNNTQVWSQRPLTPELCEYAATDVRYLHALAEALSPRMSKELAERVIQESYRRTVAMISSNKDLRAAAPVMIARRLASSPSAAAGADDRNGRRRSSSGAVAGGGSSRDAVSYMGLMEWLTAALLVQYDRYGVAVAEPLPPPTAMATVRSIPRLRGSGQTRLQQLQQQQQQQVLAAAPLLRPPPDGIVALSLPARTATSTSPVAAAATATSLSGELAAATGAIPVVVASQLLPQSPAAAVEPSLQATGSAPSAGVLRISELTTAAAVATLAVAQAELKVAEAAAAAEANPLLDAAPLEASEALRHGQRPPPSTPVTTASAAPPPSPLAPLPPLLVPSLDTLVWAEQSLSQLWLDLRAKYEYVDQDEELKLARLAAQWLLASRRGLVGRVGVGVGPRTIAAAATGLAPGGAGRRDPGLRWLLQ